MTDKTLDDGQVDVLLSVLHLEKLSDFYNQRMEQQICYVSRTVNVSTAPSACCFLAMMSNIN